MAAFAGLVNGDTVQVTLKAPLHYATGSATSPTSLQAVKEFTGVVQDTDATSSWIRLRGSVVVQGGGSVNVDLMVHPQNVLGLVRLV